MAIIKVKIYISYDYVRFLKSNISVIGGGFMGKHHIECLL